MPSGEQQRVKGRAVLSSPLGPGRHLLHVMVEDVSRADAAADTAGRVDMPVQGPLPAGAAIPFEVRVGAVEAAARYAIRAHVDRSGSGQIEEGDLISTQAYPVLTFGAGDEVEVRLQAV